MRTLVSTCLWMIATGIGSADPSQWGQFYARQEWEAHRQANRNIDHYNRYDPNPRSSPVQLLPLQNQLAQWAARVDEERQQRAANQANRNLVLSGSSRNASVRPRNRPDSPPSNAGAAFSNRLPRAMSTPRTASPA
jgi:hypothetical protein